MSPRSQKIFNEEAEGPSEEARPARPEELEEPAEAIKAKQSRD